MAKKKQETRTSLEEFNDSLSGIEQRVETNKKAIYWVTGIILVVALLVIGYIQFIYLPNVNKAKESIAKADREMLYGQLDQALTDYEKVYSSYSNKPANRAAYNAAVILYHNGKYKEAAKYMEKYDPNGKVIGPASQAVLGDCYVNLKQYDKAIKAFDKGAKLTKDNPYFTPYFLQKKAVVLHATKKYKEEAATYQQISDKFPMYGQTYNINIDKYLERAKALAGE